MGNSFSEFTKSLAPQEGSEKAGGASFRPTVYIGLGGFGCTTLRRLKSEIVRLAPEYADGFAFLGMDTHPQPLLDDLTANEYIPLSVGVDPHDVSSQHAGVLGWYREVTGAFRARNITSGADQTKAVGRLAFRNPPTFATFVTRLEEIYQNVTRFRDGFAREISPKVYVISTVAGGTGAGCLLDALFVIGSFFRSRGDVTFSFQAILATPDALIGEVPPSHVPWLFANSYATLKEIHHFLASGDEPHIGYDDGRFSRVKANRALLPNPIHLVGDKNEKGTAVAARLDDVSNIVVAYLLSDIQTPLSSEREGTPRVQDMENSQFAALTNTEDPRSFSSFGVVQTGMPADVVENLFALRLAYATLTNELLEPEGLFEASAQWIDAHHLRERGPNTDQLQDSVREEAGDRLRFSTDSRGKLLQSGFRYKQLHSDALKFVSDQRKALEQNKKKVIQDAAERVKTRRKQDLISAFEVRLSEASLGEAFGFLSAVEDALRQHQEALQHEMQEEIEVRSTVEQELKVSLHAIESAAATYLGRRRRTEQVLDDFDARLEKVLEEDIDIWIKEKSNEIYATLIVECQNRIRHWRPVIEAMDARRAHIQGYMTRANQHLDHLSDIGKRGKGNRFSLINSQHASQLYDELIKPQKAAEIRRIRSKWLKEGTLSDTASSPDKWLSTVAESILSNVLQNRIRGLDVLNILKRFFPGEDALRKLFKDLQSLASPLFWLDPNKVEADYEAYWIIAIHPSLRESFHKTLEPYLPGQGKGYAFFGSPYEVILYQVKYGYTLSSYQRIPVYEADYQQLLDQHRRGMAARKPVKPIHGWLGADRWDNPGRTDDDEQGLKWFVVGRAFSNLFPSDGSRATTGSKNVAYIYQRGNNYFVFDPGGTSLRETRIGVGLEDAVRGFTDRPEWQEAIQKRISTKIAEVGVQSVRERLEQEFMPVLKEEYSLALRADPDELGRAGLLNRMYAELHRYIKEELAVSRI